MMMTRFFHVFRMPEAFPNEYCFGGGVPVNFQMVDWFGGPESLTRDDLNSFVRNKRYAVGKLLIIERNFDNPEGHRHGR